MQRYKGLGEMDAEQLWETTLDRNARSLLQVKIKEGDDADDVFVKLMGDVVSRGANSFRKMRSTWRIWMCEFGCLFLEYLSLFRSDRIGTGL